MDVETALGRGSEEDSVKRLVTVGIGIAALFAALLAILGMQLAGAQTRSDTQVSRLLAIRHEQDAPSQSWGALIVYVASELLRLSDSIDQDLTSPDPAVRAVAIADRRAFVRLDGVREVISSASSHEELPSFAKRALELGPRELRNLTRDINARQEQAEAYSERGNWAARALFLVAMSTALLGLAGVTAPTKSARIALIAAVGGLALAAAIGVLAILP